MLAPRPPARGVGARGRAGAGGGDAPDDAASGDVQRLLDAAAGSEVDWAAVQAVLGDDVDASTASAPALPRGGREVIEGVEIVNGVDEVQVLATFYDQDDARGLLRERQTEIPEEYKDYWSRAVDIDIADVDGASRAYRAERERAVLLEREAVDAGERIAHTLAREDDRREFRSLLTAINSLNQSMADLDTFYDEKQTELGEIKRPPDAERRAASRAQLRRRLEDRVAASRNAELAAEVQMDLEADVAYIELNEYSSRRDIERAADSALLHSRFLEIQARVCVRLAEEETSARVAIEDELADTIAADFAPLHAQCVERTLRQGRIAELRAQLGRGSP